MTKRGKLWCCAGCNSWVNRLVNGYTCPYCGNEPEEEVPT